MDEPPERRELCRNGRLGGFSGKGKNAFETVNGLPLSVDPCKGEIFQAKRLTDNIARLRVVAKVYVGIVLWFGVLNVSALVTGSRSVSSDYSHAVLYGSLLVLNVTALVGIRFEQSRRNKLPKLTRLCESLILLYILITLILGALISLIDQPEYGHLMVFTMNMLICSAFFLTETRQIAIPILVSSVFLLVGLPYEVQSFAQRLRLYQDLIAYVPIALAISRVLYKAYCANYRSSMWLEREIEKNRLLNSRLELANDRLEALALIDELTGIANRRGLHAHLDEQFSAGDESFLFAAIMVDVDYFKEYNDHYGHTQGDKVLARIAHVLQEVAEESGGFVSRWGGEEFLYVARGKRRESIIEICKLIRDRIDSLAIPHVRSYTSNYISLSQGACSSIVGSRDEIRSCIEQADYALYATKTRGRNGYAYLPLSKDA